MATRSALDIPQRPSAAETSTLFDTLGALINAKHQGVLAGRAAVVAAWPAIERVTWVRWHFLEEGLHVALAHSDLHDAAFLLRTMTLELGAIERVLTGREVLLDATSSSDACAHVERHLQRHVLPATRVPSPAQLLDRRDRGDRGAVPERLRSTAAALNPFVHPNAPAQELAAQPELPAGPTRIMQATAAVYDFLAALPDIRRDHRGEQQVDSAITSYTADLKCIVGDLTHRVNESRRSLGRSTIPPSYETDLQQMTAQAADAESWTHEPIDPSVCAIAHALTSAAAPANAAALPIERPELGLPQVPTVWAFGLPAARQARAEADVQAANLPSKPAPDSAYFSYLVTLVTATATAAMLRDAIAVETLARQLARGNPVATAIAARALLESRAVSMTAMRSMDDCYAAMQNPKQTTRVAPAAEDLEIWALRYLTAHQPSSGTGGLARRAHLLKATSPLDATSAIEGAYPVSSNDRAYWTRLSRAIKGPQLTCGDLAGEPNDPGTLVLAWGIDILVRHGNLDARLHMLAPFMDLLRPLQEVAGVADTGLETVVALTEQRRRPKDADWLRGFVDGDGTAADPYFSRRGRTYHEAVAQILRLKGLTPTLFQFHVFPNGTFGDRVSVEGSADLYFTTGQQPPIALPDVVHGNSGVDTLTGDHL